MDKPQTLRAVEAYLASNLDRYLALLRQMVAINSFTANASGVNQLGEVTADAFADLGFRAEAVASEHPLYGDHLVLTRPGVGGQAGPTIGLVSHLDTVFPADEERSNDFLWRRKGDRIYGPGTVDIKGGTVMIYMTLSALRVLFPRGFGRVNWTVLLNAAEEALVPDFGQLCRRILPDDSLACLVFEGGKRRGKRLSLVTARKGMATYRITVEGRGAHAGSAHQRGVNAIVQLADVIQYVARLTDYESDLTTNVGTVAGGTVINRVPHMACASGEMRAFSPDVLDEGVQRLLALANGSTVRSAKDGVASKIDIEMMGRWRPWPVNEATNRLASVWQSVGAALGLDIVSENRGGLSDGNFIWDFVPTLDGLGPSGSNAHCSERSEDGSKDQEYVSVSSFVPKATLNTLAVATLIGEDWD